MTEYLLCRMCQREGHEIVAIVTLHDKRGCEHLCAKHGKARIGTTSIMLGHSGGCPAKPGTFAWAMDAVEAGARARRSGWARYLTLGTSASHQKHVFIRNDQDDRAQEWGPSHEDLFADDWIVDARESG